MKNKLQSFFANNFLSRRWQKRLLKPVIPKMASISVMGGEAKIFYSPGAMKGPSFDISNKKEKGYLTYEQQSKNALLAKLPKNCVLYDAGANIGLFSTYIGIKRKDISIYSFEPEALAFECLKNSVESIDNKNISVHNFALGQENKTMELHKSPTNDGGHTLVPARSSFSEKDRAIDSIELKNIQELIDLGKIPSPDALKIDVEGFENEVLLSLVSLLRKLKPIMLIELNNQEIANQGVTFQTLKEIYSNDNNIRFDVPEFKCTAQNIDDLSSVANKFRKDGHLLCNYLFYKA